MAVDRRIKALNRVKNQLRQMGSELSAARGAALMTGVPAIIEPLDEIAGTLSPVVVTVDEELQKLWLQQPQKRLRNHVIHQQKISKSDLQ